MTISTPPVYNRYHLFIFYLFWFFFFFVINHVMFCSRTIR